ncbi:MAG: hypothetical protein ACD_71C00078G0001 [uncultured bacterium (gcode 4)]|uniref:ParB/Sulfiredoxin domain-containing protein n=1 Tax=uncultured bacterium (gcode 4) TaxID=1234023 RepID=K1Z5Y1_9BACT|nr:MAG: hypothetical protein ACD_71C00078G0001 [uncultured bacterium (gcode 4)]
MTQISTYKVREIIDDFAKEIANKRRQTAKPTKAIVDFRNERSSNYERDVWEVPTTLLRFRKDNGRIASDVLSFEKNFRPLSEIDEEDQRELSKFLLNKDLQKTEELKNSLIHGGQREPAIITCDGFLINGNRRKLALEELQKQFPGEEKYKYMKVVILPGQGDEGGSPTLKEIEQIENRYQLQSDGKAEYYNFDRALSIRRKIESDIPLEEQLRDDPNFVNLSSREFKKEMKRIEDEYLGPLECVDRYLNMLDRDGLYDTVSRGRDDHEGRWQAFIDYHNYVHQKLSDERKRVEIGIEEDEVGQIEDAAFKIIRKREIPTFGKVHEIMRSFPKWISNEDIKKEIIKISEISDNLPTDQTVDRDGKELDPKIIDRIWGGEHETEITKHLRSARDHYEYSHIAETPITLLEDALKKLNHEKMDLRSIHMSDNAKAREMIVGIRERIKDIEHEFYDIQKSIKRGFDKS